MSVIVVIRADTTFLGSVVEILLLVSISMSMSPWRYSEISIKAIDYTLLLVFFILYLFL